MQHSVPRYVDLVLEKKIIKPDRRLFVLLVRRKELLNPGGAIRKTKRRF